MTRKNPFNRYKRNKLLRKRTKPSVLYLPPLYRREKKRGPLFTVLVSILVALTVIYIWLLLQSPDENSPSVSFIKAEGKTEDSNEKTWQALSSLLARGLDRLVATDCLEVSRKGKPLLTLHTGRDREYQKWVARRLRQSMALAAVASVIDPSSGRILALAVYNENPEQPWAHCWKAYPAASIFKIVTASAAMEKALLAPETTLSYTGRSHTLYRRDLTNKTYRWSNHVSLEKAFARSVNSVFGKIGIYQLGQPALLEYGTLFYFNQPLPCEVPFQMSRLTVPEDPIGIAEIASGFNRQTMITPLHAAWMAAVIVENGAAPVPWLVKSNHEGKGLPVSFLKQEWPPIRVLAPSTAENMQKLMEATIRYGTCRKSFSGRKRRRYLRSVVFGGKTGNINNHGDTIKYDWFVGYGRDPVKGHRVALSVTMIHGRLLGHRANVVAFDLFRKYFQMKKKQ